MSGCRIVRRALRLHKRDVRFPGLEGWGGQALFASGNLCVDDPADDREDEEEEEEEKEEA